jgi:hypothetical protein
MLEAVVLLALDAARACLRVGTAIGDALRDKKEEKKLRVTGEGVEGCYASILFAMIIEAML